MSDTPTYPLSTQRHSLAHVCAQAVQRTLDPGAKLGIGPAIDTGFYYDFLFSEGVDFDQSHLKSVEKMMQTVIKEKQKFIVYDSNFQEASTILELAGQLFKQELLDKFQKQGEENISFYLNVLPEKAAPYALKQAPESYRSMYEKLTEYFIAKMPELEGYIITFVDLCKGPHVEHTGELVPNAFSLAHIAGAYWLGSEENDMMKRVYGHAFDTKKELQEYQAFLEEVKKRDHRVLGNQLKLFSFSSLVGAGLPLMQPKGMIIRKQIEEYLRSLHEARGYERVWTPHIAKEELYKCSGHYDKFGDELFRVQGKEDKFFMKPMNCPHHMQIFADNQFSYRDMPIRYFEPATVYRDEKKGQLSGLTRVRAITQDDGHLFCRPAQIKEEVATIVNIIKEFYTTIGMMDNAKVSLSIRDPETPDAYLGDPVLWQQAESSLEQLAKEQKLNYEAVEGEAAFYGPKLDFMFQDSLGREWQLATIQLDFNLPERFELSYINESGDKERPVVIHRAISGSLERCMGVMIEHFAGAFPVRLAPVQAIVLPVADVFEDYAHEVKNTMSTQRIRAQVDTSGDSLSKMVRNAEKMKIPYICIVGEKEKQNTMVSIREYVSKKQYELPIADFLTQIVKQRDDRTL